LPTFRIGYFEVTGWIGALDAREHTKVLLQDRLSPLQ
jgi:hypothetical protein